MKEKEANVFTKTKNFFKKAFKDMGESAKSQHEVDKANLNAVKAESRANFEENRGTNTLKKAKSQAKTYGHSMYREVCFLFTHGLLHLLKMDHLNPEDEEKMIKMQNEIMDHFKIIR